MLSLLTISVENLTRYDDMIREFALVPIDQPTKIERVLKNSKLWKTFVHIYFMFKMKIRICSKNLMQ